VTAAPGARGSYHGHMLEPSRARHGLRTLLPALLVALVVATGLAVAPVAGDQTALAAGAPRVPAAITSLKATGGKKPGTVRFRWKQDKAHTSYYVLELATSAFGGVGLPARGKNYLRVRIPRSATSYTLSAKKAARAGSPVGSGAYLYYRFKAVDAAGGRTAERKVPLRAVLPSPVPPAKKGTRLRVASYNIASVKATLGSRPGGPWSQRVDKAARIIVRSRAAIVGVQEVGPGNAVDGGSTEHGTRQSQVESLVAAVGRARGDDRYQMVRKTAYWAPGTKHGTQGERILYDTTRYRLVSDCPELTDGDDWSDSCTIQLPVGPKDSPLERRRSVYAQFESIKTGARFWFVSCHLDSRKSDERSVQRRNSTLRKRQAKKIASTMARLNKGLHLPIIVTGDLNDWQNDQAKGNPPHELFVKRGYYDASAAKKRVNTALGTVSQWKTTVAPGPSGFGTRFDYILVHGVRGAKKYVNTMVRKDARRASDHALVHATLRLPS